MRSSVPADRCIEFLMECWQNRGKIKYAGHDSQIGTGWEKLKYPFTDYRILYFLDVLSRFETVRRHPAMQDMVDLLFSKCDSSGRFTPESVHQVWSDFDFGHKSRASRWVTMLAYRVLRRMATTRTR